MYILRCYYSVKNIGENKKVQNNILIKIAFNIKQITKAYKRPQAINNPLNKISIQAIIAKDNPNIQSKITVKNSKQYKQTTKNEKDEKNPPS